MQMYGRRGAPAAATVAAETQTPDTPGAGPSNSNSAEATRPEAALKRKVRRTIPPYLCATCPDVKHSAMVTSTIPKILTRTVPMKPLLLLPQSKKTKLLTQRQPLGQRRPQRRRLRRTVYIAVRMRRRDRSMRHPRYYQTQNLPSVVWRPARNARRSSQWYV